MAFFPQTAAAAVEGPERPLKTKQTFADVIATARQDVSATSQHPEGLLLRSPRNVKLDTAESRLAWLRSEIVGSDAEVDTPFGRRQVTYADHTASGRAVRYVETYVANKVLPLYGNTHTDDSHVGRATTRAAREAARYVKRRMGGGAGDALLFCGSGATGAIKRLQEAMGVTVPSTLRERVIGLLRPQERWVVFVGPYEHHSNLLSWRQSLAEVVEIGLDDEGMVEERELERELEKPEYTDRPKLGSFSACSNVTGILTDTRRIALLLHRHGAFACFDFAASGPYVPIDMRSGEDDGYDAVFISTHKFVGGPGTPGVLLMSKALYALKSAPPSTCGGGTVSYVNGFNEKDTLYYDNIEEREDAGTPQIIQKIRAALAFWIKDYISCAAIDHCEHIYNDLALQPLLGNPNILVLGNPRARRLPVFSFLVFPNGKPNAAAGIAAAYGEEGRRPLHGRFVATLLSDLFGVQARGGCACAGPYGHRLLGVGETLSRAIRDAVGKGFEGIKPAWTRVSFAYYMSADELTLVLKAVEFIAEFGHRFLQLYEFDWRTGAWALQKRKEAEEIISNSLRRLTLSDAENPRNSPKGEWLPASNLHEDGRGNNAASKFTSYLVAARRMAQLLPENIKPRTIPHDIDSKLVLFTI